MEGAMEGPGPRLDCEEAIGRLYFFLDGELTDERRSRIALHLDECAPCGNAFVFEADLRKAVANRCRDHVPPELVQRVHAALRAEAQQVTKHAGPHGPHRLGP